jgi:signal transduction histidine kinase
VERITGRIEHLRRMTRNFMKFVDLEVPMLQETDLSAFVRAQSEELRPRMPADISLELKLTEGLPLVRLDAEQLASALENLLTNAFNAMPDGGLITLSTHLARSVQWPGSEAARDFVVLEVLDTGVGMTSSVRERVFEPGYTTHGSTGLGLALVHKIVEDHGGRIEVESEPGSGSTFSLYFPVLNEADEKMRDGTGHEETMNPSTP